MPQLQFANIYCKDGTHKQALEKILRGDKDVDPEQTIVFKSMVRVGDYVCVNGQFYAYTPTNFNEVNRGSLERWDKKRKGAEREVSGDSELSKRIASTHVGSVPVRQFCLEKLEAL